jgi:AAA family ATP:ADP antiporter
MIRQTEPEYASQQLSPIEYCMRIFTDVRPGEGRTGLMMFANVLLILCAYYLIKPMREGWLAVSAIEGLSQMEVKAYSSFAQAFLLLFIVASYGRLVDRWPRRTLITRSTLFCMSNLVIFWALQPGLFFENLPLSGIVFYLWVGMFGVFVVAQFWAFAADLYSQERGKRLLPMVAIGATSGAVVGSWLTDQLVRSQLVGTEYLLLAALPPLAVSIILTRAADATEGGIPGSATEGGGHGNVPEPDLPDRAAESALRLVLGTRFLLAVGMITLILNWVNTNGENLLFRVVQEMLEDDVRTNGITRPEEVLLFVRDGTTLFYGSFFFWVNLLALVLQSLVASRLLKYGGFGAIFLMLPVIAMASYSAMALIPVLAVVKWMKVAENATDYSINNTARHVLWLPMSREVTLKAKPAVDSLFVRVGDGLAAVTVLLGVRAFALPVEGYLALNIALVGTWLLAAAWVVREHTKLSASH